MPRKHPAAPKRTALFLCPKTSLCGPEAPFSFVLNRLPDPLPGIRRCFAPDFFLHPVPYASVRPDSARSDRAWFACLRSVCGLFRSPRPVPSHPGLRSVSFALPAARLRLFSSGLSHLASATVRLRLAPCVPSPLSRPVSFALPCLARSGFSPPPPLKKAGECLESRKNSIYL